MFATTFPTPANARTVVLVVLAVCYAYYHWRQWRLQHSKVRASKRAKSIEKPAASSPEPPRAVKTAPIAPTTAARKAVTPPPAAPVVAPPLPTPTPVAGEADFLRARAMKHQAVPDYLVDALYLDLLAKSAEKDYAPALAKLGEYAMQRGCMVEAYYWLWRARKAGMFNLDRLLRQVRSTWANEGFPRESTNEYECFTHEQGSIGYALLCIDARYNADTAKSRLAELGFDI